MTQETAALERADETMLRGNASDEALEIAAAETAMSYTHQTSARNRCCR